MKIGERVRATGRAALGLEDVGIGTITKLYPDGKCDAEFEFCKMSGVPQTVFTSVDKLEQEEREHISNTRHTFGFKTDHGDIDFNIDMEDISEQLRQLSPDFENEATILESLFQSIADTHFRVTNAGSMNPGKSMLFNAILKRKEVFKTSDIRQTTINQEEEMNSSIRLIDTPGCNSSNLEDDDEAAVAFRKSDLILFVHNIATGGLTKAELSTLQFIKNVFGSDDFLHRTCIICTRIDSTADEDETKRNAEEIQFQLKEYLLKEYLNLELDILFASPISYFQGLNANKADKKDEAKSLISFSGIEKVKEYINNKSKRVGKRGKKQIGDLANRLSHIQSETKEVSENLSVSYHNELQQAIDTWGTTIQKIRPAWEECR